MGFEILVGWRFGVQGFRMGLEILGGFESLGFRMGIEILVGLKA